jgi:hypothetical protein
VHRNLICLLVIAAAGCSSPPPVAPPSSAAPDKGAVVDWMNKVCGANKEILPVSAVVAKAPKFAQGQQPTEADRPAVIASLTELRDMYSKAKAAYDSIGPSPVPRGDELVTGHRKGLAELVPKLQGHLDNAQRFPAQGIDSPMLLAGVEVMTWDPEGPGLGDLRDADPAVAEAYAHAVNCTG